jgi:DNA-binding transcriptional LysR family regulator
VDAGQERGKQEAALELRLLRYFVAVAEELHFARAAERLGVEQSPVSRAMRDLESQLGVQLFDRSAHQTRLTWAGQVFLGCRRVLATVEQAVSAAKAAAQGYQGYLRIAICDSLAQPRIATLLARSREEEPELEIRVFELPFAQQLKGLHNDLLDIGFALSDAVSEGLVAEPCGPILCR